MKFPLKRAAPLAGHQAIIPTRRLNQFFQEKIAADAHRFRRASCSMSDRKQRYGNAMGTSSVCVRSVVEFSGGNGAPGEIRTPDPQIRSFQALVSLGFLRFGLTAIFWLGWSRYPLFIG